MTISQGASLSKSSTECEPVELQAEVANGIIKMASSSSQATTVVNLSSNGNPAGNNAYLRPTLHLTLYKAALKGGWESATPVFEQNPKAATAMIMGSMYALHVAVGTRKANEFVEKLVERMSLEEAAMVNGSRTTKHRCRQVAGSAVNIFKNPIFVAATHGIPEIVEKIIESFPVAVQIYDNERISHEKKLIVADNMDNFSNNMLHLVGNLAPSDQLNRVYGAALQMQRELQWEVEKVVPNIYQDARNKEWTPRRVLTEEHKELVKGKRWMKDAANSCSVVAALIATVVFAAAIIVLGGTNGDSEFLVFKSEKAFFIFAMSDALSLFSSTAAILMFLSMLTALYVEDDFLQALPKRLIMGLLTLLISITTMMVAFSFTLYLVFGEAKTWTLACVAESTRVLVTLFIYLQFPLLVGMFYSTYGHGIFGKHSEKPLY
ncbi:hypothetical protein J1N35_035059 [Gossypium stocksii]|uniref:PGG domain-containing protein n=1 Tax=Gossypium stocksii TaxID=47602 RepID=A0A9D3ZQL1_9ROSI|nr:hypothetical protein J1N35_035059 [Gossypium stocksii]